MRRELEAGNADDCVGALEAARLWALAAARPVVVGGRVELRYETDADIGCLDGD
ncbi:MAG: hypothetical protein AAF602_32560 [Myxococcota bacterium]